MAVEVNGGFHAARWDELCWNLKKIVLLKYAEWGFRRGPELKPELKLLRLRQGRWRKVTDSRLVHAKKFAHFRIKKGLKDKFETCARISAMSWLRF